MISVSRLTRTIDTGTHRVEILKGIDLEDASAALNTVHILGDEITKGRELRLVTPSELSTILDRDPISSTDKNLGVLVLSEVVFDANHRYAVLKYG